MVKKGGWGRVEGGGARQAWGRWEAGKGGGGGGKGAWQAGVSQTSNPEPKTTWRRFHKCLSACKGV